MVVLQWLRQVEEVECHRFETSLGYVLSKKKKAAVLPLCGGLHVQSQYWRDTARRSEGQGLL